MRVFPYHYRTKELILALLTSHSKAAQWDISSLYYTLSFQSLSIVFTRPLSRWRGDIVKLKWQRFCSDSQSERFWSASFFLYLSMVTPLLLRTYKKQSQNRSIKCLRLQNMSEGERGAARKREKWKVNHEEKGKEKCWGSLFVRRFDRIMMLRLRWVQIFTF